MNESRRTLIRELMILPADRKIKVGSSEGSGFFYCGTVEDMRERVDAISDEMDEFFKTMSEKADKDLSGLAGRFPRYPRTWGGDLKKPLDDWILEMVDRAGRVESRNGELLHFCSELGKWAAKVGDQKKTAQNAKWKADSFTPLRDRPIEKAFIADCAADPEEPIVIVITGHEPGKYWTMEEARNGK